MIFFINKTNGDIVGLIAGRQHDEMVIENAWIQPSTIQKNDILKFCVPYSLTEDKELLPNEPFREIILAVEDGKKDPYSLRAIIENNIVVSLVAK